MNTYQQCICVLVVQLLCTAIVMFLVVSKIIDSQQFWLLGYFAIVLSMLCIPSTVNNILKIEEN